MSDSQFSERPNTIHWPPILYAVAFLLPWLLQAMLPLPSPSGGRIADDLMLAIGCALMAIGVTVGYLALKSFMGVGTPFDPTARAEKLVSFGLYNRTRNPMYLGAMIAFFGLALASRDIWRYTVLMPLFLGLEHLAIEREEAHLESRFGDDWRDYAARVRRWW